MIREKFLRAMARFACHRYKTVISIAVILTILAVVPMLRTGYTTAFNVARMLPQDIPASRAFTRAITDFGTADEAIVMFRLNPDDPRAIDIAGSIADKVAVRVREEEDINSAFDKLLTEEEKNQLLYVELPKHGMLLLPKEEIEAIKKKLTPEQIKISVEATARKLMNDTASQKMQEQILINALGLGAIFQESFTSMLAKDDNDKSEKKIDTKGYLVSPKGEMLLLVIEPKYAAQSIPFSTRIMKFIEQETYDTILGAKTIREKEFKKWNDFFATLIKETGSNNAENKFLKLFKSDEFDAVKEVALGRGDDTQVQLAIKGLNRVMRTPEALEILPVNKALSDNLLKYAVEVSSLGRYNHELVTQSVNHIIARNYIESIMPKDLGFPVNNAQGLPLAALKSFQIEFAGGYQIARAYGSKINGVMIGTLAISAICVLAFFGYCFRRYGVLIYIGIPLIMIIFWTAGIGWMLFGQLNLVSCAFAAVLVGLGIDYAVHIYNRYIEERAIGGCVEKAFEVALGHTGWGVIVGMATTCLAFLALNATRFRQLSEFGALGAIGIFLSAPAMMLVMPALVSWRAKRGAENIRTLQPTEFFLPRLARIVFTYKKTIFALSIVGAIISVIAILIPGTINFNSSMGALRPHDRAFDINGEIAAAFANRNPNKLTFMVLGDTEEQALAHMSDYEKKLDELQKKGLILGYESMTRYLPSPETQHNRLALLRGIDFERALADFQKELEKQEMDKSYFSFNTKLLQQHAELAKGNKIILPSDFKGTKISRLVSSYIAKRQREYELNHNDLPKNYPITLAKAATQFEDNILRFPAGTVLTQEQVLRLNPPDQHPSKRVKSLTVYEGGYAVKATVFPPVPKHSKNGEPVITKKWLQEVGEVLGLEPAQFEAKANNKDFRATLTGVSVTSAILAQIVKEDFMRISIWITAICLCVVNLFYHPRPLIAFLSMLPLAVLAGFEKHIADVSALSQYMNYLWIAALLLTFIGSVCHKKLLRTVYCFIPVGLGLLYMFGFMAIVNLLARLFSAPNLLDLNFVNVLTIPIIIGVGVDNGIHLVNRYFESGRRIKPVVVGTGRALMITALTSIVGFGSLYWAKFQGLDSIAQLGVLSVIALVMVLFASIVVFPAIVSLLSPGYRRRYKK